ncbi:MAG: hypothetical protein ACRCTE_09480 [Cellulosilyticaceae bacterium]
MKTVTICGSMRYADQMKKIAWDLECIHNLNVLQCMYRSEDEQVTQENLQRLVSAHYKKIDLSDGIYVVDIDGYIGEAVRNEIYYAQQQEKQIIYHSSFKWA